MSDSFGLQLDVTCIFCDNQSCVKLSKSLVLHDKSKHKGSMKLQYVEMDKKIVDVLIKTLAIVKFEYFREILGVIQNKTPQKRE